MKRTSLIIALVGTVLAASPPPVMAQWQGMPVWNNPKGGTGITINGDVGLPNTAAGKGNAYGARATVGFTSLSLTAGFSSWKPDGFSSSTSTWAGVAQFRVIGGSLMPVAINIQLGAGSGKRIVSGTDTLPKTTNIIAGAGISVNLPTPGLNLEPYLSVSNRWHDPSEGSTESNVGWVIGANVGLGMWGLHVAYDSEKYGGTTYGVWGIGAHFALNAPVGM